jgi:PTS system nitrogen regulatory IIA component
MSNEDFDIDSLATYLHLTPQQVERLASRDKLPGRRVGGEWRFSQAEIHHWLEDRIGLSDESELLQVEGVLERHAASTPAENATISELLLPEAVILPINARSKWSVVDTICEHALSLGLLWDANKMAEAIRARENLHPTALESGVALLHPRRPMTNILADPFLILGRTHQGIPFGGPKGQLTDIFFLIASADDQGHLRTLARLSRLLAVPETISDLRAAESAEEMYRLLCQVDDDVNAAT